MSAQRSALRVVEPVVSCDWFLAALFPDETEEIRLRAFKPKDEPEGVQNKPKKLSATRARLANDEKLQHELIRLNERRGIYFVVNSGGDNDGEITRYNAFFVESDVSTIAQQHERLDDAPLKPSARVETRKSVHAYWLIEGDCDGDEWRDVQRRLIEYFGGDVNIKNPSRVMRLPDFDHLHYDAVSGETSRKQIECVELEPSRRYTVAEMRAAFPAQPSKSSKKAHIASAIAVALELRADAEPPAKLEALHSLDPRFEHSWNLQRIDFRRTDGTPDANRYDLSLATFAAQAGWRDQEIVDLLIAFRRRHDLTPKWRKSGDALKYYQETIAKARAAAHKTDNNVVQLRSSDTAEAPSAGEAVPLTDAEEGLTDLGNARRLVRLHGQDLRYCHATKTWFVWNGRYWQKDNTGKVMRRAIQTVTTIYAEARNAPDAGARKVIANWAKSSESADRLRKMVEVAQSLRCPANIPVSPDELDSNPFLFNCKNGTIDLTTGELREHRRDDLITKCSPVEYDPEARDEVWEKYLHDATGGNVSLQLFLQCAVGYSLTGDTREEVLFFIHGEAVTGKSTFIEAIKAVLGDYAATADFEAFLARQHVGSPRNDIARLAGARFVSSVEVDEGKRLAEGLVKLLTGNDKVTARLLYKEAFEFYPTFKLWLAANHAPRVCKDDEAMWRRIHVAPFAHVVPKSQRDPKIKAYLRDASKAGSAILAWMVRGCLEWQRGGLAVPQAVEDATQEYRESQDRLKDFISECCVLTPSAWIASADLRTEYKRWAEERGEKELLVGNQFTEALKKYGCKPHPHNNKRGWQGIGLVHSAE